MSRKITELKSKAEQGDIESQFELGKYYAENKGIQYSVDEANKWFLRAAEQGHSESQLKLGNFYCNKYNVLFYDINPYRAPIIRYSCPHPYEPTYRDYEDAIKWYQKSESSGNLNAQMYLAKIQFLNGHYNESFAYYMKSAIKGNAEAQFWVGLFYEKGKCVDKNCNEAVKWYRQSAKQNNALGQLYLGRCYFEGNGVPKKHILALKLFFEASERGNETANVCFHLHATFFDYVIFFFYYFILLARKPIVYLGIILFIVLVVLWSGYGLLEASLRTLITSCFLFMPISFVRMAASEADSHHQCAEWCEFPEDIGK